MNGGPASDSIDSAERVLIPCCSPSLSSGRLLGGRGQLLGRWAKRGGLLSGKYIRREVEEAHGEFAGWSRVQRGIGR